MRILFLTAQLPEPPHAGGALRINGLMRGVHAAGHEVHLLAFADPDTLAAHRTMLEQFCTAIETVPPPQRTLQQRLKDLLFSSQADMQRRFASPEYEARLEHRLKETQFDLVQIESLEMAIYLPVIERCQPQTPRVYDSFNAEYELQHSVFQAERSQITRLPGTLYSWMQWKRLTRFEREVCASVTHTIAVSDEDAAAFRQLLPNLSISVVPNGIDAARYAPAPPGLNLGPAALVFTGSMSYRPNVDAALWFAEQVLPKVRQQVPDARFFIVGSQPHPRLASLRDRDDVQITGWVPEVNPFLHAATLYIAPLRMGSGTRLKLLQAMAAQRAVVSTRTGAQGLDVRDGVELRLADDPETFAHVVVELLDDEEQRQSLGAAGAAFVKAHHDWSVIVPKLLRVYDRLESANAYRQEKKVL